MSILRMSLENLFQKNSYLKSQFKIDDYFEYLEGTIKYELKRGSDFLNPIIFSQFSKLELKDTLSFLISISSIEDNRILDLKYVYECINCGNVMTLNEKELYEVNCKGCGETEDIKRQIELGVVDLQVCFEIDEDLRRYIKKGFNDPSSNYVIPNIAEKVEGLMFEPLSIDANSINSDVIIPTDTLLSALVGSNRGKNLLDQFGKL